MAENDVYTVLICIKEKNKRTGVMEDVVSHGVDWRTGKTVILPNDPVDQFPNVRYSDKIGEYVMTN